MKQQNRTVFSRANLIFLFLLSICLVGCVEKTEDYMSPGRILYAKILSEFNEGIYLMNAEGNDAERLTPAEIVSPPIISPVFSPNGNYIAFGCESRETTPNICIIEREDCGLSHWHLINPTNSHILYFVKKRHFVQILLLTR